MMSMPVSSISSKQQTQPEKQLALCVLHPSSQREPLGEKSVKLTIGDDPATGAALKRKGATAIDCSVDDVVVDVDNKVVSTPSYMLAESILEIEPGINKLVDEVLALS